MNERITQYLNRHFVVLTSAGNDCYTESSAETYQQNFTSVLA